MLTYIRFLRDDAIGVQDPIPHSHTSTGGSRLEAERFVLAVN